VAKTLDVWQAQSHGLPGGCSKSFGKQVEKKPLSEQAVSTQAGVSDIEVCSVTPHEDVSPSTL